MHNIQPMGNNIPYMDTAMLISPCSGVEDLQYIQVHAMTSIETARTISIDYCSLPGWVLQLLEQGALGFQVLCHATESVHLVFQDVGENSNVKVYIVTPATSKQSSCHCSSLCLG